MKVICIIGACTVLAALAALGGHHIQKRRLEAR